MEKDNFILKHFFLALIFLIGVNTNSVNAQFYVGGQSPASLKWKQINSEYFQIIFPEGYESQANYIANTLEYSRSLVGNSLQNHPPKISVVLHNRTVNSNAEVGWAPRRVTFFTQAPQDTYAQEWLQQLAIHEYRHVVQIDKMHQGITRILYALFGEQITAGVYGLFVPWWFIEGDAVVTETALSDAGRGRESFFEMEMRAQVLQKGGYSYDKASYGSYKDFTTSHYHLGYYLVGHGRAKYGMDLWNHTLNNVAQKPYSITPFSNGIKQKTGLNKIAFYKSAIADLDSIWNQQDNRLEKTDFIALSQAKTYQNYLNPSPVSADKVVAIKKEYDKLAVLVSIDEKGNETKEFLPGRYFPETLSVKNGIVCWVEYEYDPRWTYQSFTRIYTYSLAERKKREITSRERLFAPALNHEATKIVVVESSENDEYNLAIIELLGGKKERVFQNANNDFLSYPSWSDDEKKIIAISLNKQGKNLVEFDVETGKHEYLLHDSPDNISKPIYWNHYIIYQADYSGISNIYAYDKLKKKRFQITSSTFGAHSPKVWKNALVYADYTADGNQIAKLILKPESWKVLTEVENLNYPLAEILHQQEDTLLSSDAIPQTDYEVKKYGKLGHLINPHSWGPFTFNVDNYSFKPGASISSQNKLSSFFMSLGYEYDMNYGEGTYYADASYLGWYPALSLRADYGYRERMAYDVEKDSSFSIQYNETNLKNSMYIPLFYSSGNWFQYIEPRIVFEYKQVDVLTANVELQKSNYKIIDLSFSISNYYRSTQQDMYPKWGQSFDFQLKQSPFDDGGDLFALNSILYFPGLKAHHGLRLYFAYQKIWGNADFYNNQIATPRGYSGIHIGNLMSYKLDYKLPIAYPDFSFSSLIYIKRIKLALFYDEMKNLDTEDRFRSIGNDLLFDVHLFRSFVPFEIGLRSAYLVEDNSPYFGFLGSINI